MTSTLLGDSFTETEEAVFYHGFKKKGVIFSALNYVLFREEHSQELFFGKIQSIFLDKETSTQKAEVTVFQFVAQDQKRTDSDIYNELWNLYWWLLAVFGDSSVWKLLTVLIPFY